MENRFKWEVSPTALSENTVNGEKYRFTVLTKRLIRLEYSEKGIFEDRASLGVFYRDFEKTEFSVNKEGGMLVINTGDAELRYKENEEFRADTLSIKLLIEPATLWRFGDECDNLGGTYKTLDTIDGAIPLDDGVVSSDGVAVIDDSDTLVLGDDGWVNTREPGTKDLYFFGYGYDYLESVKAYYKLTGMPPMLPAYALGNWWSRYYPYSSDEYLKLMQEFKERNLPFSVGVIDMDWHTTAIPEDKQEVKDPQKDTYTNYSDGWTGYSWNKELFPDYKAFLRALHEDYNLKTALNLHPASGVRPHEDMYEEMCKALGKDPKEKRRIKFDILSKEYMEKYFDILHHPYEENGVDFWWMDWQQGTDYNWIHAPNKEGEYRDERERLDPLWMLNHLHILDISRNGKRPMFFSRYCGVGSQRYPVGFSGDTIVSWNSLNFQPEFTATASNAGYCWWSHDIGGHMEGYRDEELYLRWLQLGVFSPINRLHSAINDFMRKEPWCFGSEIGEIACEWIRLRHRLFPYLYTMNYRTATEGEPLVQPMYYKYPKFADAYRYQNQYFFGSELMVAPITSPTSKTSKTGSVKAWMPKGDWFDFFTGLHYKCDNNRKMELCRKNSGYPVFAKAGAIVPMYEYDKGDNSLTPKSDVTVLVFPGADGKFSLYEDAGDGSEYLRGGCCFTDITLKYSDTATITIAPARGDLSLLPSVRNYNIGLRGFNKNVSVSLFVGGKETKAETEYEKSSNTVYVKFSSGITDSVEISVTGSELMHDNSDVDERIFDLFTLAEIEYNKKQEMYTNRVMNKEKPIHSRLRPMASLQPEYQPITKAVRELLTLTKEEFVKGTYYATL